MNEYMLIRQQKFLDVNWSPRKLLKPQMFHPNFNMQNQSYKNCGLLYQHWAEKQLLLWWLLRINNNRILLITCLQWYCPFFRGHNFSTCALMLFPIRHFLFSSIYLISIWYVCIWDLRYWTCPNSWYLWKATWEREKAKLNTLMEYLFKLVEEFIFWIQMKIFTYCIGSKQIRILGFLYSR